MTIRVPTLTTRTVEGQVLQAPMMQARVPLPTVAGWRRRR